MCKILFIMDLLPSLLLIDKGNEWLYEVRSALWPNHPESVETAGARSTVMSFGLPAKIPPLSRRPGFDLNNGKRHWILPAGTTHNDTLSSLQRILGTLQSKWFEKSVCSQSLRSQHGREYKPKTETPVHALQNISASELASTPA